jgi:fermentation-respiration switch protein FrsA (DUF1100 family)
MKSTESTSEGSSITNRWLARTQAPGYWRNLGLFALGTVLAGIVVLAVWLAHAQAMSFVHPRRIPPSNTPSDLGIADWEEVRFPTPDGLELAAWFLPPDPEGDGATLIYLHGARNNREEMLDQAAMLHQHEYGALLLDMRAHGESEGTVSTLGYAEVADLRGAVAYLQSRPEVNAEQLGVVGNSMGGAVAIRGAAGIPEIRAVVAQSAYTSVEDNVATGVRAFTRLPPFLFARVVIWFGERETGLEIRQVRPIDDVARIAPRAILIVQGELDPAVPLENGIRLYEAAGQPKEFYLVPGAGHGGFMRVQPQEFERRVVGFLNQHLRET